MEKRNFTRRFSSITLSEWDTAEEAFAEYKIMKQTDILLVAARQCHLDNIASETLMAYSITEHNQDAKYDVCCGEIADGSVVNVAYQVNSGIIKPDEVDYNDFLKDNGQVYPQQYSFHTLKAISCINVLSCGTIKNINKFSKIVGSR